LLIFEKLLINILSKGLEKLLLVSFSIILIILPIHDKKEYIMTLIVELNNICRWKINKSKLFYWFRLKFIKLNKGGG